MSVPDLLSPAALAFDSVALEFDRRYGEWRSVAAQRRAVRRELLRAFPRGARVLEIGGGTGEDALFLIRQGRDVLLTDASPAMVHLADAKLGARATNRPRVVPAEHLDSFAVERESAGEPLFDGAFSNFAALNCVTDQVPVARGLAGLVRPGARVLFVIFGTMSPGEFVVRLLRREPAAAFRRLSRGDVHARLAKREFTVRYHRSGEIIRAMSPWFRLVARRGIGVFVPPSAAEPWISAHPRLLDVLESLDRAVSRPLALLADHVLYEFERTSAANHDELA
ncbi:MAG: class I SAM-dependent methyltransferase [Gemmatimonadales bacterium]